MKNDLNEMRMVFFLVNALSLFFHRPTSFGSSYRVIRIPGGSVRFETRLVGSAVRSLF